MRMTSAWTKLILENTGLKSALICLTFIALALTALLFEANSKEPLIIDRACYSKAVDVTGNQQTKEEIESFIRLGLSQRFDSDVKTAELLDLALRELKAKEQRDLADRQMKQFVHVNSINGDSGSYTVDADRVISVGNIRSALRFPLTIKIAAISRSVSNPYGLILVDVVQVKESKGEK